METLTQIIKEYHIVDIAVIVFIVGMAYLTAKGGPK